MADSSRVAGFIGIGAMGMGMAKSLVKAGFTVQAFDAYEPTLQKAVEAGMRRCDSPQEVAAAGVETLVLMVINCSQAEQVLWGEKGAVASLRSGAVVVLGSTVPPAGAKAIGARLKKDGFLFVDAPVSGGVAKAAEGALTIMAGGEVQAFAKARKALEGMSQNLYHVGKNAGDGSSVKMVNQLLAGVHIASAAEAMALAARAGLDTRMVFEIITKAAGNSWMFENRVPRMLDEEYEPAKSQLNIFVKDLGIVLGEARDLVMPCPLAAAAHQQFLSGAAAGRGTLDDSSVVKVFEQTSGVRVAQPKPDAGQPGSWSSIIVHQSLQQALKLLPAGNADNAAAALGEVRDTIRAGQAPKLVVLDDDPTGTQTVQGIMVLTEWSIEALARELSSKAPGFFILTNSRALPTNEAEQLIKGICANVKTAAEKAGIQFTVVLRGDSCLRGHYPAEADAASAILGEFDATVICPFFQQGGRYTIGDIHYVGTGDTLTPAADTEFAKDKAFGYKESNLKDWVEEKTRGRVKSTNVASVSIEDIRTGGPEAVKAKLMTIPKGGVVVVNAVAEADLAIFAAGLLRAQADGRKVLCRTAASFVSARMGINSTTLKLVGPAALPPACVPADAAARGGLVFLGSYVPKSTTQVNVLKEQRKGLIDVIEIPVKAVLQDGGVEAQAAGAAKEASSAIAAGRDVLVMTSRELVYGSTPEESLQIGNKVSSCLVQTLQNIEVRPRYLLAKGGITSSDIATKGCGAADAMVAGQAAPAVPLWLLGNGSRWASLPYIVFPGNVGVEETLAEVVAAWAKQSGSVNFGWWA